MARPKSTYRETKVVIPVRKDGRIRYKVEMIGMYCTDSRALPRIRGRVISCVLDNNCVEDIPFQVAGNGRIMFRQPYRVADYVKAAIRDYLHQNRKLKTLGPVEWLG